MLRFKVKEVLDASGKKNPATYLIKFCDMTSAKAYNIINNKQESFNLKDISKICENLNCTPNDLLYWNQTDRSRLPETHVCITELKAPDENNWSSILGQLSPEKIEELKEIALQKISEEKDKS